MVIYVCSAPAPLQQPSQPSSLEISKPPRYHIVANLLPTVATVSAVPTGSLNDATGMPFHS